MENILKILSHTINSQQIIYVFPTQIAAETWIERSLEFVDCGAVAKERFIAWDTFKQDAVKTKVVGKKSISAAIRTLFIQSILQTNALKPFFTSLIPPQYKNEYKPFVPWLTRLLPSLFLWKQKNEAQKQTGKDNEDTDLLTLYTMYEDFLNKNTFFEPSWEIPPFTHNGKIYYIFYPEIIEDFAEYELLLKSSEHIHLIYIEKETQKSTLSLFSTSRQEIAFLMQRILTEHLEHNIEFSDIAVSIADLASYEPYIVREMELRSIPYRKRYGKPLTSYAAGSFFILVQNCVQSDFSLSALNAFLSQTVFPWKEPALNSELVEFGINNFCVCSLKDFDVWDYAFKNPVTKNVNAYYRLSIYFNELVQHTKAIISASSFVELRQAYFTFCTHFFDLTLFSGSSELFPPQNDAIMARCIEELTSLIMLENEYPHLFSVLKNNHTINHCGFFIEYINSKTYVPKEQGSGVHLFDYKTASGSPFLRHFVLNVSQNSASIVYSPLSFLAQEKRQKLNIHDENVSAHFLNLYAKNYCSQQTFFSCAQKTFLGYSAPHGYFESQNNENSPSSDFFKTETQWWAEQKEHAFPQKLFLVQKNSFFAWNTDSLADKKMTEKTNSLIKSHIAQKKQKDALFSISASDMNLFFECKTKWFFSRILSLKTETAEKEPIDNLALGTFYHALIKKVLSTIKEPLHSNKIDKIKESVKNEVYETIQSNDYFTALLSKLTFESAAQTICAVLNNFFEQFLTAFSGCIVYALEKKYNVTFNKTAEFVGCIDCVLENQHEFIIIDFKKSSLPKTALFKNVPENPLKDFQMTMYKHLLESAVLQNSVVSALYVSIEKAPEANLVFGKPTDFFKSKRPPYETAAEFEPVMKAYFESAYEYVQNADLSAEQNEPVFDDCLMCEYKHICRTTYTVAGESTCRLTH